MRLTDPRFVGSIPAANCAGTARLASAQTSPSERSSIAAAPQRVPGQYTRLRRLLRRLQHVSGGFKTEDDPRVDSAVHRNALLCTPENAMETTLKTRALALVASILVTTTSLHLISNYAFPGKQVHTLARPHRVAKDEPLRQLGRPTGIGPTSTIVSQGNI
jgi:hypothetical protein